MSDYTDIQPELDDFENAVYGEEVRGSMISAIKKIHDTAERAAGGGSGSGLTTAQKSTLMAVINAIGAFNVPNGQELIDAFNTAWETTVESISVSPTTLTFNGVEAKTITATTVPSGEPVIWTSSDTSVADVEGGQVYSVGNGTCTITASSGDKSATCTVTVTGIARRYTVTNNLTNVTNSNDDSLVAEGGTYEGTLTANSGYELGTVTVTMGGTDITSTAYSNGNISIANVTGNIVITANGVVSPLLYNWDLTSSLTDTVDGNAASALGDTPPTISAQGAVFTGADLEYIDFPNVMGANRTIHIHVVSSSASDLTKNNRLAVCVGNVNSGADTGLMIRRNTNGTWAFYNRSATSWETITGDWTTDPTYFSGKTLKIYIDSSKHWNIYADNELLYTSGVVNFHTNDFYLGTGVVGSSSVTTTCSLVMCIDRVTVYDGEVI